jgi:hypothetical protein
LVQTGNDSDRCTWDVFVLLSHSCVILEVII